MSDPGDDAPDASLWRAVDVFRVSALLYAVAILVRERDGYLHPVAAWLVLAVLAGWTILLLRWRQRTGPVMAADLGIAVLAVLATVLVDAPARIAAGEQTLPAIWPASAVLAWAVWGGWRRGLLAALAVSAADLLEVRRLAASTANNIVLLLLTGVIVGYAVDLARAGRRDLARAIAVEAASRERERLARDIHDSVLQVLAYVQRRGGEIGGEAADLGRLAGEQEIRLRSLVSSAPTTPRAGGQADLRAALSAMADPRVTVAGPAQEVPLPADAVAALAAATRAALDNVAAHAGPPAHAWVLVEDDGDAVTVTVRDDGAGMPAGRLADAEREGRLGVVASIRGRVTAVGGVVEVTSAPGQGTEVEMRVPRAGGSPG